MNYKQAYKSLYDNGTIALIIDVETKNNNQIMDVKVDIMDGIKQFIDFTENNNSFEAMKYTWSTPVNLRERVIQKIYYELAKIKIKELNKILTQYNYMINVLPETTKRGEVQI